MAFVYSSSFKMVNLLQAYCTKCEGMHKTNETSDEIQIRVHRCGVSAGLGKCQQGNSMSQPNSLHFSVHQTLLDLLSSL